VETKLDLPITVAATLERAVEVFADWSLTV
jgi:hypothetical protein